MARFLLVTSFLLRGKVLAGVVVQDWLALPVWRTASSLDLLLSGLARLVLFAESDRPEQDSHMDIEMVVSQLTETHPSAGTEHRARSSRYKSSISRDHRSLPGASCETCRDQSYRERERERERETDLS